VTVAVLGLVKPVFAMLHLGGDGPAGRLARAQAEAETLVAGGVD